MLCAGDHTVQFANAARASRVCAENTPALHQTSHVFQTCGKLEVLLLDFRSILVLLWRTIFLCLFN